MNNKNMLPAALAVLAVVIIVGIAISTSMRSTQPTGVTVNVNQNTQPETMEPIVTENMNGNLENDMIDSPGASGTILTNSNVNWSDTPMEEDVADSSDAMVKTFTVEGSNFSFSLPEIRVQEGDKVQVTFMNKGGMHDFVLDEFGVRTPIIQTGESTTVNFIADKTGRFEYYCSVATHRQMGMKGILIVE